MLWILRVSLTFNVNYLNQNKNIIFFICEASVTHFPRVIVSNYDCRMSDLTLGNVFCPAPKHMIRLSVDYWQDSKIPIRLWKSLVGDTPNIHTYIPNTCMYVCVYVYIYIYIYIYQWRSVHISCECAAYPGCLREWVHGLININMIINWSLVVWDVT